MSAILAGPAYGQRTPAGTAISNTASLEYDSTDRRITVASNSVSLTVDATIDVAIVPQRQSLVINAAASTVAVAFVVTNQGNARETFTLTAATGTALKASADEDGDGVYDAARDTATSVTLDAGSSRTVFAIVLGPVTAPSRVAMTAAATTSQGAPGQLFAGAGSDGADVVIGTTGGVATAYTTLTVSEAPPTLVKSQSVVAPDGSARVLPGSTVTYQLEARFADATRAAAIADDVPAGTTFVPGSITLDGRQQTDAADTDDASFDGATIRVVLGDVTTATVRTVRFQTKIK